MTRLPRTHPDPGTRVQFLEATITRAARTLNTWYALSVLGSAPTALQLYDLSLELRGAADAPAPALDSAP
jgi:hypothetical protein